MKRGWVLQQTSEKKNYQLASLMQSQSSRRPKLRQRPDLTNQSQHADLAGQSHSDHGEGRNNDRDGVYTIITKDQDAGPCSKTKCKTVAVYLHERMNPSRWWQPSPAAGHRHQGPDRTD
ncbi:hypothetical protein N7457_004399 [Penicillium paradoxum]|uniref:uncharacterized protein n=1 Tax=Penicillium paradoxum TaxID=176176 RepID=UPI0025491240|nr:uncharacterized protein N7457_004399 [Penicillium paradoxum]KAJ5782625.1 hypothetical protein N7457_004399 [Penicillium paradoxum]